MAETGAKAGVAEHRATAGALGARVAGTLVVGTLALFVAASAWMQIEAPHPFAVVMVLVVVAALAGTAAAVGLALALSGLAFPTHAVPPRVRRHARREHTPFAPERSSDPSAPRAPTPRRRRLCLGITTA